MRMREKLMAFFREEEGLTTVEYAIAGGLVGAAVVGIFFLLGEEVEEKINDIVEYLNSPSTANG